MLLRKRANDQLTAAELNVVRAILAGHTTGVALRQALIVAHGTIAAHLENIYRKTGAANRADIVLMARGEKPCAIDLVTQVLDASGQLADAPEHDEGRKR